MRRLFTIVSTASLLLCLGAITLWWRSWHHADLNEDRHSWRTERGDRCTIRSDAGQITWFTPPPGNPNAKAQLPPSARQIRERGTASIGLFLRGNDPDPTFWLDGLQGGGEMPTARETAAAIRNEQLEWNSESSRYIYSGRMPRPPKFGCWTRVGSAAFLFGVHDPAGEWIGDLIAIPVKPFPPAFSAQDAVAVLLPALEDPKRFAAAHFLLMHLVPQVTVAQECYPIADDMTLNMDGLRVDMKPWSEGDEFTRSTLNIPARYDPSQLPMIRDQWHRRLDVAAYSAPWWAITAATGLLPAIWITRFSRRKVLRRRRIHAGQCLACGYDMRSSAERCPECGAATSEGEIRRADPREKFEAKAQATTEANL